MRLAASPVPVSSSSDSLIAPPSISFAAGAHAIGLWKDAVELTRLDHVAGRGEPGDHPGPDPARGSRHQRLRSGTDVRAGAPHPTLGSLTNLCRPTPANRSP